MGFANIETACAKTAINPAIFDDLEGYLYAEVAEFMKSRENLFILTIGDEWTQNFKIEKARIDLPALIIGECNKI